MDLESSIRNIRQTFNPLTLTMESSLILKFLFNSIKELKNPQEIKPHDLLLEKIEINDFKHDAKQNPVLLVPGYLENPKIYYHHLDNLRKYGIVHAYWVPLYSFKSIEENSKILLKIIDDVLDKTKRSKINLIGHSMGGLVVFRTAIDKYDLIDKCIAIGSPLNGTKAANLAYKILEETIGDKGIIGLEEKGYNLEPLKQMFYESEFVKNLKINNSVDYYSIFSENDEIILPWESSIIQGATNININKSLGLNNKGHIRLLYEKKVRQIVSEISDNALDKERFINH